MFDQKKVKNLVLSSLVADAYSLGAHWVYDEKQLANESIDWNELNTPLAIWHKEKKAGDFTHYGDQAFWLYDFLKDKDSFDINAFRDYWFTKMETYEGYIDGATRNTIQNIKDGVTPSGSDSTDLSVVGRIVPLLKVSKTKEEFFQNVKSLTEMTHNSQKTINATRFFAKLLVMALDKKEIEESIEEIKHEFDTTIQGFITNAIESKDADTFDTIRSFGPACDVDEGFGGILHILCKYENFKDMMICNAKAGGDSSARAMIAAAIFMANQPISQIPQKWLAIKEIIE